MESRVLKFVADACAGELWRGEAETSVGRLCTDSRHAQAGDLFFALHGERFDGHDFINDVAAKGVAAVVVARERRPAKLPDCGVIGVADPRVSLGLLAAAYRAEFHLPVVAIGGSNGKTTTKELVAAVLRQKLETLWSEASFNNDIGVPITLLRLERAHEAAVVEIGTNHPGEVAPLARLARPDFGIITNIGREHLEFFGDEAGVALEEGSLAEELPEAGRLFLNGDDPWSGKLAARTKAAKSFVGFGDNNDWRAIEVSVERNGVSFDVVAPDARFNGRYRIHLLGRHQVANALFAIAVGAELGVSREEIQSGLAECRPARMRLQMWEANGVTVLDDTYNANADSMLAALRVLKELPGNGRRIAILGDMAELGEHSEAAHAEVGRSAAELGVGQLFAVGTMASSLAESARAAGLSRVMEFPDVEAATGPVKHFVKPGDVVLLKASRVARLERLVDALRLETVVK